MKYCYWTSNCSKGISNIENYKCCNDCKKKDCEVRCKDCYDNCKYAATQEEIEQYVGKWTKPYIKPVVKATKPTVEKAVEIPQDITKLAQLLNVKRDKVAYLVKEKKMSFDDVYRKLKQ